MTQYWMMTTPLSKGGELKHFRSIFQALDGKRYQIGIERGKTGYRHAQIRFEISSDKTQDEIFKILKFFFPKSHIMKAEIWTDYEGKDGYFISDTDTPEIRSQRFGTPTDEQKHILNTLESNNDRQVTVWFDQTGGVGKSWLTGHLWERHKAHAVRMTSSAENMIKDVASKMSKERRPIVVIDIPRSGKLTQSVYEAIEVIKDGLIDDPRYQSNALNIKGVKVLVMTNKPVKLDKLSQDRWVVEHSLS